MKLFIFVLLFVGLYFNAECQYKIVEGEFGLSSPLIIPKAYSSQMVKKYPGVYLELRFNIPSTRFSVGSQFYVASWDVITARYVGEFRTTAIATVFDYHIDLLKKLQLFVGTGIGIAYMRENGFGFESKKTDQSTGFIAPRIGLEAWNRVRVGLNYNLTAHYYSGLVFKIGFVIGGGKKN